MCNLYSETKGQAAIGALFRTAYDRTGNLPAFPGIFPDQLAPILRNSVDGERELVMRAGACRDRRSLAASRSRISATWQARTGAAGSGSGIAASSPRHRSASTPTRSPARRRRGLHSTKSGRCSPSRACGRGGGACAGRRARRSRASMSCSGFYPEANAIVAPIHPKAMPVILTTTEEFDLWLEGETIEALKLQRPLPEGMLDIVPRGEKEDAAVAATLTFSVRIPG